MIRLFFALWPEAPLAGALAATAARCAQRLGGRATRVETIHMTLAFLGGQPVAGVQEIIAAARAVCAPPSMPFTLRLDTLGGWRHNRLLWAGCASPPEALSGLAEALRARLQDAGVVFNEANRSFFPHVTLVRKLPAQAFPLARSALSSCGPFDWSCRRFVLVESRLSASGAAYRVIESFPLG